MEVDSLTKATISFTIARNQPLREPGARRRKDRGLRGMIIMEIMRLTRSQEIKISETLFLTGRWTRICKMLLRNHKVVGKPLIHLQQINPAQERTSRQALTLRTQLRQGRDQLCHKW